MYYQKIKIMYVGGKYVIIRLKLDSTNELKTQVEEISKCVGVQGVEICTDDVEESELKTVGERIAVKSCSDVADVTLPVKKWNVRKRDTTH